jgi:hypothetical protein
MLHGADVHGALCAIVDLRAGIAAAEQEQQDEG